MQPYTSTPELYRQSLPRKPWAGLDVECFRTKLSCGYRAERRTDITTRALSAVLFWFIVIGIDEFPEFAEKTFEFLSEFPVIAMIRLRSYVLFNLFNIVERKV